MSPAPGVPTLPPTSALPAVGTSAARSGPAAAAPAPAPPRSRQRQRGGGRSRCVSGRGGRKGPAAPRETAPGTSVPVRNGPSPPRGWSRRVEGARGLRVDTGGPAAGERPSAGLVPRAATVPGGPSPVKYRLGGSWKGGARRPYSRHGRGGCTAALQARRNRSRGGGAGIPLWSLSREKIQHLSPSTGCGQGWPELGDRRLNPALYNALVKQLLKTLEIERAQGEKWGVKSW